jgi:hypothetical protein
LPERAVATRTVDVFIEDRLVTSYEFEWEMRHAPLFDQDFIDRARDRMRADNYSDEQIALARFSVRD